MRREVEHDQSWIGCYVEIDAKERGVSAADRDLWGAVVLKAAADAGVNRMEAGVCTVASEARRRRRRSLSGF